MRSRTRRVMAAAIGVIMLATGLPGTAVADDVTPSPVIEEPSIPGGGVDAQSPQPDPAELKAVKESPVVTWPAAGAGDAIVPADTRPPDGAKAKALDPDLMTKVGTLPVWVGPASTPAAAAKAVAGPSKVHVELRDQTQAAKAGVDGMLLKVTRADGGTTPGSVAVQVDYSGFREAYGADWAARLRVVGLPECALTTPDVPECREQTIVVTENRAADNRVTSDMTVTPPGAAAKLAASAPSVFALAAAPAGAAGDLTATALSASATWQAGGPSADFSWNYPIRVPAALNGPTPELSISYTSSSVDGRTSSTNNQTSWIGEGFQLSPGFIERKYKACADDLPLPAGNKKTGDQCWGTDNATLTLGGNGTDLVRDAVSGVWRPKVDDGSRVERLTDMALANGDNNGEYWRYTTTNGVEYYFGRNRLPGWAAGNAVTNSTWTAPVNGNGAGEPCHDAPGWCQQAWRWNLDYVVDPHGNTMAYYYNKEIGWYGRNSDPKARTEYVRGGTLDHVDYGMRRNEEYAAKAPMKVLFETAERCIPGTTCNSANAKNYPDTPWDQNCAAAPCTNKTSATYWSTKRLNKIRTQLLSGAAYRDVESWTLNQQYPDPGDGTSKALWLESIVHSGHVGGTTLSMPEVNFDGVQMANRVDGNDGQPPINRYRIYQINNESGGATVVQYSEPECVRTALPTPDSNTKRCFPSQWTPPNELIRLDWFHRYVVKEVVQHDLTTGGAPEVTKYEYLGAPAWHYNDDELTPSKYRTWSEWRGYEKVEVRRGAAGQPQTYSQDQYFRGMHGDRKSSGPPRDVKVTDSQGVVMDDSPTLQGFTRETIVRNGPGGAIVSATVNDPVLSGPTATRTSEGITTSAFRRNIGKTKVRTAMPGNTWRTTETRSTYDNRNQITQLDDLGDTAVADDDQCTRTWYARDETKWFITSPSRVETVGVDCGKTAKPQDAISDVRNYYDDQAFGLAPKDGDLTKVEAISGHVNGAAVYSQVAKTEYDKYGRKTKQVEADGQATTTAYTPASGGPVTRTVETNALGHTNTSDLEAAWGLPVLQVDANGKRTTQKYDPLGRLVKVWLPGRDVAASPSTEFSYLIRKNGPVAITAKALQQDGSYKTTHDLYDGLLRARQTQAPAPGGGRVLTDTFYDSRGSVAKTNAKYYNASAPSVNVLVVGDNQVPGQSVMTYDGVDRTTVESFRVLGVEKWKTATAYEGNRVTVTPPPGAAASTTISDARGRMTELRQYHGSTPTGDFDTTKYGYTKRGEQASITDPVGNVWLTEYDLFGHKTRGDDPDKGTSTYTYNNLGQMTSSTDSRNRKLFYAYDLLGRKTDVRENAADGPKLMEWTYDTVAKGQQSSAIRYQAGSAYTTSTLGFSDGYQPTGTRMTVPEAEGKLAGTYDFATSYNVDGSTATRTLPAVGGLAAETLTYRYDALGNETTLAGQSEYVSGMTYTKFGEPAQRVLGSRGNRVWLTNYFEEGTRRLSTSVAERERTAGTQFSKTSFTYDPAGNVTKLADAPKDQTADVQCFRYDHLRRLTNGWTAKDDCAAAPSPAVVGGPAQYWNSYEYDKLGNRKKETQHLATGDVVKDFTYPEPGQPQPHALKSVNTNGPGGVRVDVYDYDTMGNSVARRTQPGDQTLDWDAEGKLAKVTQAGKVSTFLYDTEGARLMRRDDTGSTLYLAGLELRQDKGSDKAVAVRHYTHGSQTIATRTSTGLTWLASDHHDTAESAVDSASLVVTKRRSTPFGAPRGEQPKWPNEKGFVGGTVDAATGLTDIGARQYDQNTGRFISVDPVLDPADPQQMHGYAYSNNNPTTFSDPTGLRPVDCEDSRGRPVPCPVTNPKPQPGPSNGGGNDDDYEEAKSTHFGDPPTGDKRYTFKTKRRMPGHGIIIARFFISGKNAAFGLLTGDNRGFTTDPDADYRMVMAWDTDTGEIAVTITASQMTKYPAKALFDAAGGTISAKDIKRGGANDAQLNPFNNGVSVTFSGLNSLLPCCSVNGTLSIELGAKGTRVKINGDNYPDVEVNQYRAGAPPHVLGRDRMGPIGGGLQSHPLFPGSRRVDWVQGTPPSMENLPQQAPHAWQMRSSSPGPAQPNPQPGPSPSPR